MTIEDRTYSFSAVGNPLLGGVGTGKSLVEACMDYFERFGLNADRWDFEQYGPTHIVNYDEGERGYWAYLNGKCLGFVRVELLSNAVGSFTTHNEIERSRERAIRSKVVQEKPFERI